MSPAIIVALTPLWLGVVGVAFVLTIGRRLAQKERAEREENREVPVQYVLDTSAFHYSAGVIPLISNAEVSTFFGQNVRQAAEDITQPKQSQAPRQPHTIVGGRRTAVS